MIVDLSSIPNADNLNLADVSCGPGRIWKGIVRKEDFKLGDWCNVYLPDAIVPPDPEFDFMKKYHYRVRQMKLRGCPSECLIMPYKYGATVGDDVTVLAGVQRYEKNIPASMRGVAMGSFPPFLRKTDEPNFQSVKGMVDYMVGLPYYATEKVDGTSCTIYNMNDHFGVCSRRLELVEDDSNIYWKMAKKYGLDKKLPQMGNYAVQGEIAGPGIQGNPLGLKEHQLFVFDVTDINDSKYLGWRDLFIFCHDLGLTPVNCYSAGYTFMFNHDQLQEYVASKTYANGHPVEGAVFRTLDPMQIGFLRCSFKVINLNYKEGIDNHPADVVDSSEKGE